MKNISGLIYVALAMGVFASCSRQSPPATTVWKTKILFVGDSLTAANDLPRIFATIAESLGQPIDVMAFAPGGARSTSRTALESNAFVQRTLPAKAWDFVVLQEHSTMPAYDADFTSREVTPYVGKLADLVRGTCPKARLVYFATWGFKNGDTGNCAVLPEVCTFNGMQDRLLAYYEEVARENSGIVAPVGSAWRRMRRTHPEIELYGDDHHPSREGTYLSACVIYSILFQKRSTGANAAGLDLGEARMLQKAADATMFESSSNQ